MKRQLRSSFKKATRTKRSLYMRNKWHCFFAPARGVLPPEERHETRTLSPVRCYVVELITQGFETEHLISFLALTFSAFSSCRQLLLFITGTGWVHGYFHKADISSRRLNKRPLRYNRNGKARNTEYLGNHRIAARCNIGSPITLQTPRGR